MRAIVLSKFGAHIRRRRSALGLGLRNTARDAGVSATFLSRIETGAESAVPSEKVIRKLATILDDDFDQLMALAGRISQEVGDYVKADPQMPEFLRRAKARHISADDLMKLLEKTKGRK